MEDTTDYENITAEEYVRYLHIAISHIEDKKYRSEMVDHLYQIKDQLHFLETCYDLEAYEPA